MPKNFINLNESEDEKESGVEVTKPPKTKKTFDFCQKSVLLTFPQSKIESREILANEILLLLQTKPSPLGPTPYDRKINILVIAQEHHKDGHIHYHCWIEWTSAYHSKNCNCFDMLGEHPNIGQMKNKKKNSRNNALEYLMKEDPSPYAYGIDLKLFKEEKEKKKKRHYIGKKLINGEKTVEEIVQEFPEELYNYDKLKTNLGAYKLNTLPLKNEKIEAMWIWGKSGIGKTYWVHNKFGDSLYQKESNKWWDGYQGQETILIDDLDSPVLGHYLKIWGDNYKKMGEIKGGHIPLPYKRIIITSNYLPDDLFKDNPIMIDPIKRRFLLYTIEGEYPQYKLVKVDIKQVTG